MNVNLIDLINEVRERFFMSQKDFAQESELSPAIISRIIRGKAKPRLMIAAKILKVINGKLGTNIKYKDLI
jgi:predicted transcriptional regulator